MNEKISTNEDFYVDLVLKLVAMSVKNMKYVSKEKEGNEYCYISRSVHT